MAALRYSAGSRLLTRGSSSALIRSCDLQVTSSGRSSGSATEYEGLENSLGTKKRLKFAFSKMESSLNLSLREFCLTTSVKRDEDEGEGERKEEKETEEKEGEINAIGEEVEEMEKKGKREEEQGEIKGEKVSMDEDKREGKGEGDGVGEGDEEGERYGEGGGEGEEGGEGEGEGEEKQEDKLREGEGSKALHSGDGCIDGLEKKKKRQRERERGCNLEAEGEGGGGGEGEEKGRNTQKEVPSHELLLTGVRELSVNAKKGKKEAKEEGKKKKKKKVNQVKEERGGEGEGEVGVERGKRGKEGRKKRKEGEKVYDVKEGEEEGELGGQRGEKGKDNDPVSPERRYSYRSMRGEKGKDSNPIEFNRITMKNIENEKSEEQSHTVCEEISSFLGKGRSRGKGSRKKRVLKMEDGGQAIELEVETVGEGEEKGEEGVMGEVAVEEEGVREIPMEQMQEQQGERNKKGSARGGGDGEGENGVVALAMVSRKRRELKMKKNVPQESLKAISLVFNGPFPYFERPYPGECREVCNRLSLLHGEVHRWIPRACPTLDPGESLGVDNTTNNSISMSIIKIEEPSNELVECDSVQKLPIAENLSKEPKELDFGEQVLSTEEMIDKPTQEVTKESDSDKVEKVFLGLHSLMPVKEVDFSFKEEKFVNVGDEVAAEIVPRALDLPTGQPLSVLDSLIRTLLSQNTTDSNSRRAFASLKSSFPTWEQVLSANRQDVEEAIRCGGLAEIKAQRIQDILNTLKEERGELDLEYLRHLTSEEVKSALGRFKGVGPKTVACVLMFHLDREEFPVDTHVFRITKMLGWVPPQADRERAYLHLNERIPNDVKYGLHCLLVTHGKHCPNCAKGKAQRKPHGLCPLVNWNVEHIKYQ